MQNIMYLLTVTAASLHDTRAAQSSDKLHVDSGRDLAFLIEDALDL